MEGKVLRRPGGQLAWRRVGGQLFEVDLARAVTTRKGELVWPWAVQLKEPVLLALAAAWDAEELEVLDAAGLDAARGPRAVPLDEQVMLELNATWEVQHG